MFSVTLQTRFCWNAYKYCIHHWVDINGNGFHFLSIQKCFLKMACSLPLYNGVIMHIKNLKDAIKTKTKNLRRNLKALTQLHCIKLTAGYIFVKETIMRLRKFVFYIPGILLKKANIILSRLRNSLMTLILASRVQNVEIHIRFDGINCIFFIVHI